MNITEQVKSVKDRIEKLRFQLAVEEKVLTRLKAIEEPTQSNQESSEDIRRTSYGSITGQLKQILQESDRPMTIKQMERALVKRGIKSKSKLGFNVAISSALFKRKDIFRRIERGVYELKDKQRGTQLKLTE